MTGLDRIQFRPLTAMETMTCRAHRARALAEALRSGLPSRQRLQQQVVAILQEGGFEVRVQDLERAQAIAARLIRGAPADLLHPAPPGTPPDELEARGRRIVEYMLESGKRLTEDERRALELAGHVATIVRELLPATAEHAADMAETAYRIYLSAVDEQGNQVFESPEAVLALPAEEFDRLAARAREA